MIYGNYKSAIDQYEGGTNIRTVPGYSDTATAGVFCTYPQPFLTTTGMFFSEFIASAMLVLVIFALKDDANLGAGNLVPLGLFFLIFGLGATLGWETGYAINLARDFGPRLFTYFVGYGHEVWSAGNYYFWVRTVDMLIALVLILIDTHGCTVFRMYLWWVPVRYFDLYRPEPNQYSMDGMEKNNSAGHEEGSKALEGAIRHRQSGRGGFREGMISCRLTERDPRTYQERVHDCKL